MHPALHPQKFASLPLHLRTMVNSAATGSVQDLRRLRARIPMMPTSQAALLLPAFFASLDPAGIPEHVAEDEPISPTVSRAVEAIKGLYSGLLVLQAAEAAVFPQLWTRCWPWITFLRTYLECWPGTPPFRDDDFYIDFVMFVGPFQEHNSIGDLLASTPGVRFMLAKAWMSLIRLGDAQRDRYDQACQGLFACVLGPINAADRAGLAEFSEGAGGTIDHLASLVISFMDHLAPSSRAPMSATQVKFLVACLTFVNTTDDVPHRLNKPSTHPLCSAMRPQGLARSLTTMICAISASTAPHAETALHDCFTFLGLTCIAPRRQLWIAEALKYGLLRGMLRCSRRDASSAVHKYSGMLLMGTIPSTFVYYCVVTRLQDALRDITDLVRTSPLRIQPYWADFVGVAEERIRILKSLESSGWASYKACTYLKCGKIRNRRHCARCSSCRSTYYCSGNCQALDWREGGHRSLCAPELHYSLNEFQDFSWHDRTFMRAILTHDYRNSLPQITRGRAEYSRTSPGETNFVLFSYLSGIAQIRVKPAQSAPPQLRTSREWDDAVTRIANSAGRAELHVMWIQLEENVKAHFIVPLRRYRRGTNGGEIGLEVTPAIQADDESDSETPTEIY
ncbi:hypothetical protein B0H17DRAFT_1069093 [Mycena rosella]|uniref:MYND-type domain-containing protein n=1 Tax=Mycena rosella TaxID=1033263 RepID=A0AAD7DE59_MYCRO|nr:hypothetical protein B0H17DRAFT_1069093 [Mycena rosella]